MTVKKTVADGNKLPHELHGQIANRYWDIIGRLKKGVLDPLFVLNALQDIAEGRFHSGRRLLVDYSQSLAEMIAAGRYDWVNSNITAERFPLVGKGKQELVPQLIHFNRVMTSDEVEQELDKKGLRPATLPELLAFGATFPELQRKFPIVALSSVAVVHGCRLVACLCGLASGRDLDLGWRDGECYERCRFLAVPK